MRENRTSGSEGGEAQTNELSLPLSLRRNGACKLAKSALLSFSESRDGCRGEI